MDYAVTPCLAVDIWEHRVCPYRTIIAKEYRGHLATRGMLDPLTVFVKNTTRRVFSERHVCTSVMSSQAESINRMSNQVAHRYTAS